MFQSLTFLWLKSSCYTSKLQYRTCMTCTYSVFVQHECESTELILLTCTGEQHLHLASTFKNAEMLKPLQVSCGMLGTGWGVAEWT